MPTEVEGKIASPRFRETSGSAACADGDNRWRLLSTPCALPICNGDLRVVALRLAFLPIITRRISNLPMTRDNAMDFVKCTVYTTLLLTSWRRRTSTTVTFFTFSILDDPAES